MDKILKDNQNLSKLKKITVDFHNQHNKIKKSIKKVEKDFLECSLHNKEHQMKILFIKFELDSMVDDIDHSDRKFEELKKNLLKQYKIQEVLETKCQSFSEDLKTLYQSSSKLQNHYKKIEETINKSPSVDLRVLKKSKPSLRAKKKLKLRSINEDGGSKRKTRRRRKKSRN